MGVACLVLLLGSLDSPCMLLKHSITGSSENKQQPNKSTVHCIQLVHDLNQHWYAARDTAAKLCGIVVLAVQLPHAEAFMAELNTGFADHDIKKHKFELQDGYLAATGYILAQSMTGRMVKCLFVLMSTLLLFCIMMCVLIPIDVISMVCCYCFHKCMLVEIGS